MSYSVINLSSGKKLRIEDIELMEFKKENKGYLDLTLDTSGKLLITEETFVKYLRRESGLRELNITLTNKTRDSLMITGFFLGSMRALNPREEVNVGQVMLDAGASTWAEIRLPEDSAKLGPIRIHYARVIQ